MPAEPGFRATREDINHYHRWRAVHWRRLETLDREEHRVRQYALNWFTRAIGRRYADSELENFRVTTDQQRKVVDALMDYDAHLVDRVLACSGVVLYGPSGTGKDHLLVGLAKQAIRRGFRVEWVNGPELFAKFRKYMKDREGDEWLIEKYGQGKVYGEGTPSRGLSHVLIVSDPVPARGELSEFNTENLWRVIDARYRANLITWTTMNVGSGEEAEARLGVSIVDRLRDGALSLFCNWPSYRKGFAQC